MQCWVTLTDNVSSSSTDWQRPSASLHPTSDAFQHFLGPLDLLSNLIVIILPNLAESLVLQHCNDIHFGSSSNSRKQYLQTAANNRIAANWPAEALVTSAMPVNILTTLSMGDLGGEQTFLWNTVEHAIVVAVV